MSDSFSRRLSKITVILASACGIALGLCGLNALLFSTASTHHSPKFGNFLVFSGATELIVASLSLVGLLIVGLIVIFRALFSAKSAGQSTP